MVAQATCKHNPAGLHRECLLQPAECAAQARAIGPAMKALAVVLKALLQQAGLNERVAGGLGSYCLLNLVMAHLMFQVSGRVLLSALTCGENILWLPHMQ